VSFQVHATVTSSPSVRNNRSLGSARAEKAGGHGALPALTELLKEGEQMLRNYFVFMTVAAGLVFRL